MAWIRSTRSLSTTFRIRWISRGLYPTFSASETGLSQNFARPSSGSLSKTECQGLATQRTAWPVKPAIRS